jgi:hypothetical protein
MRVSWSVEGHGVVFQIRSLNSVLAHVDVFMCSKFDAVAYPVDSSHLLRVCQAFETLGKTIVQNLRK